MVCWETGAAEGGGLAVTRAYDRRFRASVVVSIVGVGDDAVNDFRGMLPEPVWRKRGHLEFASKLDVQESSHPSTTRTVLWGAWFGATMAVRKRAVLETIWSQAARSRDWVRQVRGVVSPRSGTTTAAQLQACEVDKDKQRYGDSDGRRPSPPMLRRGWKPLKARVKTGSLPGKMHGELVCRICCAAHGYRASLQRSTAVAYDAPASAPDRTRPGVQGDRRSGLWKHRNSPAPDRKLVILCSHLRLVSLCKPPCPR